MIPRENYSPDFLAQLEAYYDGELPAEEATLLRQRLAANPELAATVRQWEAVHRHGLRSPSSATTAQRDALRDQLGTFEAELKGGEARVRRLPVRQSWLVAAAVLLLLVAGWWVLRQPSATEQLAMDYFEWLPRQEATLGPAEDAAAGLLAYDRQEYAEAYPLLTQGVATGALDSVNLLYAGVAALGAGAPEEAESLLSELLETGRYALEEGELRYYLALAQLQLDRVGEARQQLEAVRGGTSTYRERAQSLLDDLPQVE